jgi:malate synthase
MSGADRVNYSNVPGAEELFTPEFLDYIVEAYDRFSPAIVDIRSKRDALLQRALKDNEPPTFPPESEVNTGDWQVPALPDDLLRPGIEISGPVSITNMAINALNPGAEGERAEGYLDDDEDSGGHCLADTVQAALNRRNAVTRTLTFHHPVRNRTYEVADGELPFFMHRERGTHLDEPDFTVDGNPIPPAILGTALTLAYAGREQAQRGQGVYFYLPKIEVVEETRFYREFFDFSKEQLGYADDAVIKAVVLIESLPAVYIMDEMLWELGPYAGGLNAARWDLKASILEYVMTNPDQVWPDRFGVDIKTTEFIINIFRRLVAVCLKRGAAPVGGMATALPSRDDEVNEAAGESIRQDKEWEAQQGFLRGWVAHIFHMKTAADPFKEVAASGWKPTDKMRIPANYPVVITPPEGPITVEGSRRNARMLIEYAEGWLTGRGAKGIDSLEGQPGIHPALMEDLATGRISVAQTAQRILHKAKDVNTGQVHDFALIKQLLQEELADIIARRKGAAAPDEASQTDLKVQVERYESAYKVAMLWVKNYTELNFRSLGSYTLADLETVASEPEVF